MMMQSVPKHAFAIVNGAMGSVDYAKKTGEGGFDKFLDNNIKRDTKIPVRAKTINENNDRTSSEGKDKIMGSAHDNKAIKSDNSENNTRKEDELSNNGNNSLEKVSSDLVRQVLAMLSQIRDTIMEELELTPEEMDSMMDSLGLSLTDLADPQAIQQLVLLDSGVTDPMAMLLDEQLGDAFQGLLAEVEDIRYEAFPKLTDDEIKQLLEQFTGSDNNDDLAETIEDEHLQALFNNKKSENESEVGKDRNIKFDANSEDNGINDNRPIVAAKDNSGLSDSKGNKEGFDKTEGFEAFLDNLSANYDKSVAEFNNDSVRLYDIREIAQQIIDQIRVTINPEQTTMELQLNPEHLGKVNLTISSKEGAVTAHFVVQNELAKEAVEGQMITLKETLDQQGIKVENIEVTVASYTFDQNNPSDEANQMKQKKQSNGHKITFEEAEAMSEEPINEEDTMNHTGITNYTVNYTA